MSKRTELFKNDMGIDLGTTNTRVFAHGKGFALGLAVIVIPVRL